MQNKKIFLLSLIIPIAFLALAFAPKVFAAYDCTVAYPGSDATSPFTYDACCYPEASEPYQGIYCRPDDAVVQKKGNNPPTCSTFQEILDLATIARGGNKAGFNCFSGTVSSACRANYCKDPAQGNQCVAINGAVCPSNLYRSQICPGGCGQCLEGYTYCVNNLPTNLPDETLNPSLSCSANKDGSTFGANGGKTCAELGKDVLNPCTGECTGCPQGRTPSGKYLGVCVTYGERFLEIFDDGLTWLGGHIIDKDNDGVADDVDADGVPEDNAYDYSPTGPTGLKDTYLKSDIAWNLDWSNPDLPPNIKWLLSNYYTCQVDADCDAHGSGMKCSASGLCYTPGYTIYSCNSTADCTAIDASLVCDTDTNFCYYSGGGIIGACTNDSECDWLYGFICTPAGTCGLPGGNTNYYYDCNVDADCSSYGSGYMCSASGYCYNPNDGDGYACDSHSDCNWLDGYECQCDFNAGTGECNTTGVCKVPTPEANLKAKLVGMTPATYDGNDASGYKEADLICAGAPSMLGSHVCSNQEMINSYIVEADALSTASGVAWINVAGPGNTKPAVNDCNGWTDDYTPPAGSDTGVYYGSAWVFSAKSAGVAPCNATLSYACCK